jgi:hypothetical protein
MIGCHHMAQMGRTGRPVNSDQHMVVDAEAVKAPGCEPGIRGFESLQSPLVARKVQLDSAGKSAVV